jgi:hypothetical protein
MWLQGQRAAGLSPVNFGIDGPVKIIRLSWDSTSRSCRQPQTYNILPEFMLVVALKPANSEVQDA